MQQEIGSSGEIYEGSVRDRLNSLFLASGGNVSKAVEHRLAIAVMLREGTAADLRKYFQSNAFELLQDVRAREMRYAAMTAVAGILFSDESRRSHLLALLSTQAPHISAARLFVSKAKYFADNKALTAELASAGGVSIEKVEVLMEILEETSGASIDMRGRNKDVTRALENIFYGGLSTMDAVLSHMHECIVRNIASVDPEYTSLPSSEKNHRIKTIMTVSLHRIQAVAGMRHELSTKLLNTDTAAPAEWVLRKRPDGQIVVTTESLEAFLSERTSSPIYERLERRHREGGAHLKHAHGCPVMIVPLFLHAGRVMIERYSKILQ